MNQVLNADACFNATDPQQYFEKLYYIFFDLKYWFKITCQAECKESQFYSLPFGQAVASMY